MTSPTFADVLQRIEGVDGWMTADQAERLYRAAAATLPGERIVEIGSFRGRSTIVLAKAMPPGVELVAIDPHAGNDRGPQQLEGYDLEAAGDHEAFLANLTAAGVRQRVRHVRAFSSAAHAVVDGEVAVLFVDGAHRYRPARADIRDWGARVKAGGTLLIHDSFSSVGVTLAIARTLVLGRRMRYVGRARSLAVYRADLPPGVASRAGNAARQLSQAPWFVKNVLLKVLIVTIGGPLRRLTGRRLEWPY